MGHAGKQLSHKRKILRLVLEFDILKHEHPVSCHNSIANKNFPLLTCNEKQVFPVCVCVRARVQRCVHRCLCV